MRPHSFRVGTSLLALPVLAALAAGQTVHRLTPTGPQVFADLQPAIDAAVDGDVLLVAPGTYSPFVIDGKGLSIFALDGADFVVAQPASASGSAIEVRNLSADQRVVLNGAFIGYSSDSAGRVPVRLADNVGACYLQACRIQLDQTPPFITFTEEGGPAAMTIERSRRVGLSSCELLGGAGLTSLWWAGSNSDAGAGGPGLKCVEASVALYDCQLTGGNGGDVDSSEINAGSGGAGLSLQDSSEVFVSGGHVRGGGGGHYPVIQSSGAPGAFVDASSELFRIDVDVAGGPGEFQGPPIAGQGLDTLLPGEARRLSAAAVGPSAMFPIGSFEGQRGDLVWALVANASGFRWFPFGVLQVKGPQALPAPIGVVPAGDVLAVPFDLTGVAPGVVAAQVFAIEFGGVRRLSGPRFLLSIDPASAPDCNGNGVNDYLDLVAGTSQDANANLVPDECPGG